MSDKVRILQASQDEIRSKGVLDWDLWEKGKSVFPWYYTNEEHCYLLEGLAKITTNDGKAYTIRQGDYVVFESGLECTWEIIEPVSKRFSFP
jgi:uncharacterized cupin superfamily protein